MMRSGVMVSLTLITLGSLGLWGLSRWTWLIAGWYDGGSNRLYLAQVSDGSSVIFTTSQISTVQGGLFESKLKVYVHDNVDQLTHENPPIMSIGWSNSSQQVFLAWEPPEVTEIDYYAGNFYGLAACPLWLLTVLTAAYPVVALMRGPIRRRRWRRRGLCVRCGYDLTGNTSGVCPECGTRTKNTP